MSAVCTYCEKRFSATKNMYRHVRTVHNIEPEISNKIICPQCEKSFESYSKLRLHIKDDHQIALESQSLSFPNKSGKYTLSVLYFNH